MSGLELGNPAKASRSSARFNASDADVQFISADNVIFHLHRKNLETHTSAFPTAEFNTHGELVPLTENALTLELLFQFVYPQRHPRLDNTPFEELSLLAEAAEKYEVYSAMNICSVRMKNFLPDHAIELFNYASRHDYKDIMVDAEQGLLDIPLDLVVLTLSPGLVIPWIRFRECWSRAIYRSTITDQLSIKRGTYGNLWAQLGERRSLSAIKEVYSPSLVWPHLEAALKQVPAFNTFL